MNTTSKLLKYFSVLGIFAGMVTFILIFTFNDFIVISDDTRQQVIRLTITTVLICIAFTFIFSLLLLVMERAIEKNVAERLDWLVLGNYNHAIFDRDTVNWFGLSFSVSKYAEPINEVRQKIMNLSSDIQTLSAKPSFIGSETREELLEQERHRIARELHDSVSQQLFAVMMMLSAINEEGSLDLPTLKKQVVLIEGIVNEAQIEMRALLLHLRPTKLEGKTLREGIISLLNELSSKVNMEIKWDVEDIRLLPGNEDHLFRIVQELLSNTLRHAKAKTLELYLTEGKSQYNLRVVDDGIGFDPEVVKNGSYGLMNIKERIEGMGGTIKLLSDSSRGTTVSIHIPKALNQTTEKLG